MYKIMLALHLLAVVFAVGPLVGAASTAARGLRVGDVAATATSARLVKIYSYASVVAVIFGFGLMSANDPDHPGHKVADLGDVWIIIAIVLWLFALAEGLFGLVPALEQAATALGEQKPIDALRGKVAALGGSIALNYAIIVFLMVYQPGS
ncbi:MAG: hypothetical protein ACTHOG_00090 [Marmoricola sp.]